MARKSLVEDEGVRSARLLDAQAKAADLFAAIEPRGIIAPGVRETEASDAVRDLAAEMFGVDRHWHKRIVRAGPNTLQPYRKNPPDRAIAADDIVFLDFGPIFERVGGRLRPDLRIRRRPGQAAAAGRAAGHVRARAASSSRRTRTSPASSCTRT